MLPEMSFVVRPHFSPFFDKEEESYVLFGTFGGDFCLCLLVASGLEVSAAPCSRYMRGYREIQKLTTHSSLSPEVSR